MDWNAELLHPYSWGEGWGADTQDLSPLTEMEPAAFSFPPLPVFSSPVWFETAFQALCTK